MQHRRAAAAGGAGGGGQRTGPEPLTTRQEKLKADFTRDRGYWHAFWDGLLELDPDLFEGYLDFSAYPWRHGVLTPKMKEFVYCAFDAARRTCTFRA